MCYSKSGEGAEPSAGPSAEQSAEPSAQPSPSEVVTQPIPCCILCGGRIPPATDTRRKRTLTSLGLFVSLRCQPTPHAYQFFSGVRGDERVLLCISCVNWQRRASGQGKRPSNSKPWRRPLLFLDQFALFMLRPGTVGFPDQRCVLRLVQSLKRADNGVSQLLLGLLPVQVQAMVAALDLTGLESLPDGGMLNAMVTAWWEFNGRTPFFSHHLTAKLVRRVVKGERDLKQLEELKEEQQLPRQPSAAEAVGDAAWAGLR